MRSPRQRHPAVTMTYKGRPVEVDRKIAPLLAEVWLANLKTDGSCAGEGPNGWDEQSVRLGFSTSDDAARFLDIVHEVYEQSPAPWPIRAIPSWMKGVPPRPRFQFAISVFFPRRDLKRVLRRMREHNGRAGRSPRKRRP